MAIVKNRKIEGLKVIRFSENFRPGRGMKKGIRPRRNNEVVPSGES
jgi:hypothetical protein